MMEMSGSSGELEAVTNETSADDSLVEQKDQHLKSLETTIKIQVTDTPQFNKMVDGYESKIQSLSDQLEYALECIDEMREVYFIGPYRKFGVKCLNCSEEVFSDVEPPNSSSCQCIRSDDSDLDMQIRVMGFNGDEMIVHGPSARFERIIEFWPGLK